MTGRSAPVAGPNIIELTVQPLTAATFAPFGQVIAPMPDGKSFGPDDARLDVGRGIPRFYIMQLNARPMRFRSITRHMRVTQCLASCGGKPWVIAVAPPDAADDPAAKPDPAQIRAFHVPGTLGIKLERSTWHAGPFFSGAAADFFNLELSDTNQSDYHPVDLSTEFGLECRFTGPLAGV